MSEEILLAQASVLQDLRDAHAAASGERFNLFEVIGRATDEVRTHSAIIAELLDPKGSHQQGAVFAHHFAKQFDIKVDLSKADVRPEIKLGDGSRADILIETNDWRIVIENKIYADDQPRQLERYHAYAAEWSNHTVFYLTLHGSEPSEVSLGSLSINDVQCISYEKHILDWLDDCIKEMARSPQIREILAHYQALLRKLTGKLSGERIMRIKKLLLDKHGERFNFELVPGLVEAMMELSIETEWEFWNSLKKQLTAIEGRPWRLNLMESEPISVSQDHVRRLHSTGRMPKELRRWNYGLSFSIESDTVPDRYRKDGVEVLLAVVCDGSIWERAGFVFYGFISKDRVTRNDASVLFDDWAGRMSSLGDNYEWQSNDLWLSYIGPSTPVDLNKEMFLGPQRIACLGSQSIVSLRTGEPVRSLVKDICETIDLIEGYRPNRGQTGDSGP